MLKFDVAIIGGDKRTSCMATVFAKQGYRVICFGTAQIPAHNKIYYSKSLKEAVENAAIIVGGIPFEKNGCLYSEEQLPDITLTELQRLLRKHQKIFGGVIPEDFRRLCEEREIGCYDFMKDEPMTIFNAIATAEGAILEALLHKNTQLHQSKTLVLGYGRCGKVLADKLKGLSAQVTVCSAQSHELAMAASLGFDTLPLLQLRKRINEYEYLFNTIPATVLTKPRLENVNKEAIIIDIASNQIGLDYEAAETLNLNVHFCPGLPGKYAALTCAERLTKFVLQRESMSV